MTDISVITPSFRSSEWLKLCIESVADQEGVRAEHIVQDACSDDGTQEWLRDEPRVTAYFEEDKGMYDAVNRGLTRASGDVLCYLNCDEQYLPGALQTVTNYFDTHPNVDMAFGDVIVVDSEGEFMCHRKVHSVSRRHVQLAYLPVFTAAMFFRRSLIDHLDLFFDSDLRNVGDARWVLQALDAGVKYGFLEQFVSVFAETGENIGAGGNARRERSAIVREAPLWARALKPGVVAGHRLRQLTRGGYRQNPFAYWIYTRSSPKKRLRFQVDNPTFLWPERYRARDLVGA